MKLSIIIPAYNAEKYIERSINSVLEQNLEDFEIIVINDGSTDSTGQIVESMAKTHPQIKPVNQKNSGQSVSRNRGIDISQGDYIYFIDADDYLAKGVLKKLINHAIQHNLDIITFENKVVNDGSYLNMEYDEGMGEVLPGSDYIKLHNYKNECWWYVTKKNLISNLDLQFAEGRFMEDAVFTTILFLAAERVAAYKIDGYRYVKLENSTLSNKEPAHYIKVIYDTEFVVMEFAKIIKKAEQYPEQQKCIERLKTRRDSFVFFVIIRVVKSKLTFAELWDMLMRIKKVGGYPLTYFIGEEYNKTIYKILTPVFNTKSSLKLFFNAFRLIKK